MTKISMAQKISRRKLSDAVFDKLHASITSGDLGVGDKMPSERELMDTFEVGRPTIREAMQSLQTLGLIQIAHGERARVTTPTVQSMLKQIDPAARHLLSSSPQNMEHFKEARLFFEVGIVRIAADNATDAQIKQLREAIVEQEKHVGEPAAFVAADIAFHVCIANISNNPIFTVVIQTMFNWLSTHHSELVIWTGKEHFTLAEHRRIVDCIEARDAHGAAQAMSDHLNRSNDLFRVRTRSNQT